MDLAEGIRIHQYIGDWLMRAKTKHQCQENTHRLIHLVQSLGWIINFEKSDLIPTQEIEFLGYKFDLRVGLVFPTQKKSIVFWKKQFPCWNLLKHLQGSSCH